MDLNAMSRRLQETDFRKLIIYLSPLISVVTTILRGIIRFFKNYFTGAIGGDNLTLFATISASLFLIAGHQYRRANNILADNVELADKTFLRAEFSAYLGCYLFLFIFPALVCVHDLTALLRLVSLAVVIFVSMSGRDENRFPQDWDVMTPVREDRPTRKHPLFRKITDGIFDQQYKRQLEAERAFRAERDRIRYVTPSRYSTISSLSSFDSMPSPPGGEVQKLEEGIFFNKEEKSHCATCSCRL